MPTSSFHDKNGTKEVKIDYQNLEPKLVDRLKHKTVSLEKVDGFKRNSL